MGVRVLVVRQWLLMRMMAVERLAVRSGGITELLVLRQGREGAEALAALVALYLHPAGGVHPLVPAQVRELRVRLGADLAGEGLYRAVDVLVLLQARGSSECFPALRTRMTASSDVVGANMPL